MVIQGSGSLQLVDYRQQNRGHFAGAPHPFPSSFCPKVSVVSLDFRSLFQFPALFHALLATVKGTGGISHG